MSARALFALLFGLVGCATAPAESHVAKAERPAACQGKAPSYAEVEPLFARYCVRCHRQGGDAGETLDFTRLEVLTKKRTRVAGALDAHAMPPPGLPQPSDVERERMSLWACRGAHSD